MQGRGHERAKVERCHGGPSQFAGASCGGGATAHPKARTAAGAAHDWRVVASGPVRGVHGGDTGLALRRPRSSRPAEEAGGRGQRRGAIQSTVRLRRAGEPGGLRNSGGRSSQRSGPWQASAEARVCHHPGSRLEWEVPKDPTARAHVPGRVLFRPPASAAHVPDPRASGSAFHAGGGAALRKRADLPSAVVTDLRAPGLPGDDAARPGAHGEVCGGRALLAAGGLLPVPAGHSQGAAFLPEPGQALGTVLELRVFGYERSGEPFADDPKVSAHGGHGAQDAGGCGPGPCRWGACDCQFRRVPARQHEGLDARAN